MALMTRSIEMSFSASMLRRTVTSMSIGSLLVRTSGGLTGVDGLAAARRLGEVVQAASAVGVHDDSQYPAPPGGRDLDGLQVHFQGVQQGLDQGCNPRGVWGAGRAASIAWTRPPAVTARPPVPWATAAAGRTLAARIAPCSSAPPGPRPPGRTATGLAHYASSPATWTCYPGSSLAGDAAWRSDLLLFVGRQHSSAAVSRAGIARRDRTPGSHARTPRVACWVPHTDRRAVPARPARELGARQVVAEPSRRLVLAAAAAGSLTLAGCTGIRALGPVPKPGADVVALERAIAAEELMVARYASVP